MAFQGLIYREEYTNIQIMTTKNIAFTAVFALALLAPSAYSQAPVKEKASPAPKAAVVKPAVQPAAKPAVTPAAEPAAKPATGKKAAVPAAAVQLSPFDAAVERLKSQDPDVRRQGANGLSELRDPKALPYLLKALNDSVAQVRASACEGVGFLRAREATPRLSEILTKDPQAVVRQSAAINMSYVGDRAAGPALMKALKDSDPGVRYASVRTLSVLNYGEAEDAFIRMMNDPDVNMRRGVISALGQMQSRKAVSGLRKALDDPDKYVKLEAIKALGNTGDAGVAGDLKRNLKDEDAAIKVGTALSLAKLGDASGLDTAYEFIKSPDQMLKQQSCDTIASAGDEKSLKMLEDLSAASKDPAEKSMLDFARTRLLAKLKGGKK